MIELKFFLLSLTIPISIFLGFLIASLTKPELLQGKNYFIFLKKALASLIIGIFFYSQGLGFNALFAVFIFLIYLFIDEFDFIFYVLSAAIFGFLYETAFFDLIAVLLFVVGIPVGSLIYIEKRFSKVLAFSFIFLFIANLIFLLAK